jgi:hypothetical protein
MSIRRIIVRSLLPLEWRRRYGDEVEDLLDASAWRFADVFDVALLGLALRTEALRRLSMVYYVTGLLLVGAGVAGGLLTASELTNGIGDIHEHWWSTAGVVGPVAAGLAVLVAGAARQRRPV